MIDRRDDMDRLEYGIKRLRIDFERFFNGALVTPPEELRGRLQRQIRDLRGQPLMTSADRFRLSNLEARFNTFNERFRRRLLRLERGIDPRRPGPGESGRPRGPVILDPALVPSSVERLWRQLADRRRGAPAIRADLDTFRSYLARQLERIQSQTGCERVEMRVEAEGQRLKLKARPLIPRARGGPEPDGGSR